jgi:hypothetical protein
MSLPYKLKTPLHASHYNAVKVVLWIISPDDKSSNITDFSLFLKCVISDTTDVILKLYIAT